MNFTPRVLSICDLEQARFELAQIGCDPAGINIMQNKAVFTVVKLEGISAKAANLLKQTFLAKGGDVAVNRGVADLTVDKTDVLIFATDKQYRMAISQLKQQPWGLPKLALAVEAAIKAFNSFPTREYVWADRKLAINPNKTLVMGILNVTPDSFSDGGKYNDLDKALRHTQKLIDEGADIIDIGAESTRPYGAEKITDDIELQRLLPILEKVLEICPIPVSIDTYKASVAKEALKIGAHIINDVWGLQHDSEMAEVAGAYNVPVIIMHNQRGTDYQGDILSNICSFLKRSMELGVNAGINSSNIIVDPGIGFGKTAAQNLTILARLEELKALGCPILLGTSRKRFIGEVLGGLPPEERVEGTAATVAIGIAKGANIVRVHDVKVMAQIARMTDAMIGGKVNE